MVKYLEDAPFHDCLVCFHRLNVHRDLADVLQASPCCTGFPVVLTDRSVTVSLILFCRPPPFWNSRPPGASMQQPRTPLDFAAVQGDLLTMYLHWAYVLKAWDSKHCPLLRSGGWPRTRCLDAGLLLPVKSNRTKLHSTRKHLPAE